MNKRMKIPTKIPASLKIKGIPEMKIKDLKNK